MVFAVCFKFCIFAHCSYPRLWAASVSYTHLARVKAGEQISLTELAEAVKQDKAAVQSEPKKPGRKPSIRKQLKEDKEKTKAAPKKQTTRAKTQEAERS